MPKPMHICELCSRKEGKCSLRKVHEQFIASGDMQTVVCSGYVKTGTEQ